MIVSDSKMYWNRNTKDSDLDTCSIFTHMYTYIYSNIHEYEYIKMGVFAVFFMIYLFLTDHFKIVLRLFGVCWLFVHLWTLKMELSSCYKFYLSFFFFVLLLYYLFCLFDLICCSHNELIDFMSASSTQCPKFCCSAAQPSVVCKLALLHFLVAGEHRHRFSLSAPVVSSGLQWSSAVCSPKRETLFARFHLNTTIYRMLALTEPSDPFGPEQWKVWDSLSSP